MASSSEKAPENLPTTTTPRRMFSMRIVNLDYYMAPPLPGMDVCYSEFQGRGVREVPVVRIFGSTTSGQKTCLHLHKAFPYFYVPYDSELPQEVNEALAFVRRLASSIEKAMKMASIVGARRQHLHSCSLVRGKKYYGYHPKEQLFIKIVLYYPQEVSRVSTLLLSGGIMNHKFQPHEAHFPYLLQILIDHNLYGMGYLHLSSLKFRNPLPEDPADLMSLVKRVKGNFRYQETLPQVEAAAVDPTRDYSSLKESLVREKAVSTSPLSPQPMKEAPSEENVRILPASMSSSPAFHQIAAMKEETFSTHLPREFPPTIHITKIKEEPSDTIPPPRSSSPAYNQTAMKEGVSRTFRPYNSPSPGLHLTTMQEGRLSSIPQTKSSPPAFYETMSKEDILSTVPAPKSSSPAVYQMSPDGGSQPTMWLQKSVPGDWIWPLVASANMETTVQEQGRYSRQSTCELEADASVEDILNRGELIFMPLQQAGPDIKMVQSLTPVWEEERARSGEGGPAGSIDPLYQPTPRTVPMPSPFEEAMRETLFQIARAEEQELGTRNGSQRSTQKSDSGPGTDPVLDVCTLLGSRQELKISLGSADNSAAASDEDETDERQQLSVPLKIESEAHSDSRLESTQTGHDLATAINEEIIRKQLSQRCLSQDLDREVAEFLRWMATTQLDIGDQEDVDPVNKDGEMAQMVLSQMFSSPGMDAALLKALADYENATEQECQAILDCADLMDEEVQDAVDHNNANEYFHGRARAEVVDSENPYRAPGDRHQSHESRTKNEGNHASPYIPQTDGAGDENELESAGGRSLHSFFSKRPRYDKKDSLASATSKHASSRSGLQELSKEEKREVSLRDMMRKRRERKRGRKELFSPSSSMLESASSELEPDFLKDNGGRLPSLDEKHQGFRGRNVPQDQTLQVVSGSDSPQNEDLLATTNRGISMERHLAYRKKGKVINKSENVNNMLTSKFGALPVVTLKYDSAEVDCCVEQLSERYSEEGWYSSFKGSQGVNEPKNAVLLPSESLSQKSFDKSFIQKEVTVGEDIAPMQSRGDDRDCGGGQTTFGLDQDSLIEPAPDSDLEAHVNSPRRDTGIQLVDVQPREPDDNRADCKPEADSPDRDDFFVAQTQFLRITIPRSPQSSHQLPEGLQVDLEKHENVDISSQGCEAVMMDQVPELALHQLTSQNQIQPNEKREEKAVLLRTCQDSDCLSETQVVKPNLSYLAEIRSVEFEKNGDNGRVDFQDEDVVAVEQTQSLRSFVPFLGSGDPREPHDHISESEEVDVTDADDEAAGQTRIQDLEDHPYNDITQTVSIEYVRAVKESDVADEDPENSGETQVLIPEDPQIMNFNPWNLGAFQDEGRECDMADEERPAHAPEVGSSQHHRESCRYVEGIEGEDCPDESGSLYEQTQKLELEIRSADEYRPVDMDRYAEEVRRDDTPEESCDSGAQTQILTPEEILPSGPDKGTTLEVTSLQVDDMSDTQIPKGVQAEMTSSPSTGLPVETPLNVDLRHSLHGQRASAVGDANRMDGSSHQTNNLTQYLFCDLSEDSEESYDSEQDTWCRDGGVTAAALFEDQEVGELGNLYCEVDHVEEGYKIIGTESRWDDAAEDRQEAKLAPTSEGREEDPVEERGKPSGSVEYVEQRAGRLSHGTRWDNATGNADEKVINPVTEAQEKDQDVEQMGGISAADEDAEYVCSPKPRGMHPTQYLFTDMSDDSEASYDSGTNGRESAWNAAEELFAEEEKEIETYYVTEEGRLSGLQAEKGTSLTGAEGEEHRGISQEQNCRESFIQRSLLVDISAGNEERNSALVIENSDKKVGLESTYPTFSSFKVPKPLEDGTLGKSKTIGGGSGSSFESSNAYYGNTSANEKSVTGHVCEGGIKPSAVPSLESTEDEDSKVRENTQQAEEKLGKECAIRDIKYMQLQSQGHRTFMPSQEVTDWISALVPFSKHKVDQQLIPLIFHQRPPTRVQITESLKEVARKYKEEDVFYGNVKDVSDHPVVRAGLVFDVRSREAIHLRPFQFGRSSRRSKFDSGSRHRVYIQQESWGCEERLELIAGIPTYIENDGTMWYIITPAKAPPSPGAVKQWLSLQSVHMETSKRIIAGGQQIFTMDPNTGKLVPVVEIGSEANTQESTPKADSSQRDEEFVRPASPKYDERHVLFLSHSSTMSSHGFSHRRNAPNHGVRSVNISSSSAPSEQGKKTSHGLPTLAPCSAQTSAFQATSLARITDGKEWLQKNSKSAVLVDSGVKTLVNRKFVENATRAGKQWRDVSQMTALTAATTPLSQSGFRDPASSGLGQQITLMSIEVFAETRGELLPDPRYDAIACIVLVLHDDGGRSGNTNTTVVLIRDKEAHSSRRFPDGIQSCELIYLPDEKALFKCFVQMVQLCDPDMLVGWEVQGFSLGLLAERAANLGISLLKQLSRIPPVSTASSELCDKEVGGEDQPEAALFDRVPVETIGVNEPIIDDEWGRTHGSGLYIGGRTVLNAWRIMRGEVKLNIYTIEAVAEAVLRRRVPRLPWQTLTKCFVRGPSGGRYRCIEYFISRAKLTLEIMEQLDLINRTAELARVFGIDFYSVFSRGSQFRVESMMARLAHTQNYLLVSPTRQQVAEQPGMQCLPLVMEPESRFYNSPVIVLDFQSLYPSMIIAYNLCFSTCLGKLSAENPKVLGVTKLKLDQGILSGLKESMTITPNGIMFAPKEVLPGVLPRLLQEILSTRIMVKKAMKALTPEQRVLERVLNARQFALKLIANVTYGYTAAGFSGRMPCAEIADSIVQCGRLTLERAINMVNSNPRWNARVVYGDTDSMFVLCEGRTKEEAFRIGQEIAASVTESNPPPVTLKMEKVYLPCVLLTKKRYVGYSFESPSQVKPIFDAKGIETIRRDTCPAVAKALEHSIRILFETQDLSQVKQYLQRQWGKILSGRISIQDFVFAKEVRLGTYSARSPVLPPAAIVASKAMAVDPRAEPRYAERIPYVVVHGEPGARLVDMVVDPLNLISQPSLRLHDTYYITKQIIPACQRIFMLIGVDLRAWFSEMPKVYRPPTSKRVSNLGIGAKSTKWDPDAGKFKRGQSLRHGTIDQYFLSRHCTICGEFTRASQLLCSKCFNSPRAAAILLPGRTARLEKEYKHLEAICRHCGGGNADPEGPIACISLDCSVFFERRKVHRELIAAGAVSSDLGYYPPCVPELF